MNVETGKNPESPHITYATTAQDQVFVLSATDAEKYFSSNSERKCKATEYAKANGANANFFTGDCCWWWLRTPGQYMDKATFVTMGGSVAWTGDDNDYNKNAVRPAMWIEIDS